MILKGLDKYDESRLSLEKAIELDKNYFDAYINLGLLNKDSNKYNEAEEYYLKALEINNKSAIAHLNLGACYKEKQDLDKAISKATEVVENFIVSYDKYWLDGMRGKLSINNKLSEDYSLATEFFEILETS